MGSAVAYLYASLILHNDIKPSNILWELGRGARLIDYGLVTMCTSPACSGGTTFYVSMEYLFRSERGPSSDNFALEITLLDLLGQIPLRQATERSWMIAKLSERPGREQTNLWL
jgi:serine/threonine protein kinase